MAIMINGRDLTVEQVIRVCRLGEKVEITEDAQKAVKVIHQDDVVDE